MRFFQWITATATFLILALAIWLEGIKLEKGFASYRTIPPLSPAARLLPKTTHYFQAIGDSYSTSYAVASMAFALALLVFFLWMFFVAKAASRNRSIFQFSPYWCIVNSLVVIPVFLFTDAELSYFNLVKPIGIFFVVPRVIQIMQDLWHATSTAADNHNQVMPSEVFLVLAVLFWCFIQNQAGRATNDLLIGLRFGIFSGFASIVTSLLLMRFVLLVHIRQKALATSTHPARVDPISEV